MDVSRNMGKLKILGLVISIGNNKTLSPPSSLYITAVWKVSWVLDQKGKSVILEYKVAYVH